MNESLNKESTNVLIIGKSGVGKSSLLNYMFGRELQQVGVGAPVTKMEIKEFTYQYDEHFEMHIYDTWGLEPSAQKAEEWKNTIFKEIERHDTKKISDWFNTIIFCLNAKSARVEDFELDIMEELLREKNHVTVALTHCNSKSDPDGIVLRDSVKEELEKRGIDSIDDRNFVFVSNVRKVLLGGTVEQFGKEEIFLSVIRNVWASLKSKVPYQARKHFESLFALKKEELLKKPDRLKWMVPFLRKNQIKALEQDINNNCSSFVNELVSEINSMYNDAIEYYTELSKKYAMIGFEMDSDDYLTSADIHFDAMQTIKEQVTADLNLLRERMQFLDDILKNDKVESGMRDTIVNIKIFVNDSKKIRQDLKRELERYMDEVYRYLDDHLNRIERNLDSLEIDDLYVFQTS
ncbi:MAG TPA: hypothetical protein DCG37_05155 [Lachnospiraceae bacterium]|nr:hypothetical protein [Lachnospiraceae bacterium]